ncbi:MAG TPA: hypothetical protein VHM90_21835 [Phycisphaerae bacterium]|nr:hypothetical protein [Phycisphaerae bacterium]
MGAFAAAQSRPATPIPPAAQETIDKLNADLARQKQHNEELQAQVEKLQAQLGVSADAKPASASAAASRPVVTASRPATATKPAATRGTAATDADIEKALLATVKELNADKMNLEKVLAFLRDAQDINMVVNWNALQTCGVDRNTPVTANLKNVTFEKALATVLSQVAAGQPGPLDYSVSGGVLNISSRDEISSQTSVRNYDVRRLLANKPNIPAAVEELTALIKRTAQPDSWRDNGGTAGAISYNNGTLIITQNYHGHKAVAALLATLH